MFADWFKTILKIPQNLTVLTTLSLVASFAIVMGFQVSILKKHIFGPQSPYRAYFFSAFPCSFAHLDPT